MRDAWFIRLLPDYRRWITGETIRRWVRLLMLILTASAAAGLIDAAYEQTLDDRRLRFGIILVIVLLLVRVIFSLAGRRRSVRAANGIISDLRAALYEKLLRFGLSSGEYAEREDIFTIATDGVDQLESCCTRFLPRLIYGVLAAFTVFFFLLKASLASAAVLLLCSLLLLLITAGSMVSIGPRSRSHRQEIARRDRFREILSGLTTLRLYHADGIYEEKLAEETADLRRSSGRAMAGGALIGAVMDILTYGGIASGMIVVLNQLVHGSADLADALEVCMLAPVCVLPLRMAWEASRGAAEGLAAGRRIFSFLELREPEGTGIAIHSFDPDIRLSDVKFSHDGFRDDLRGLDFHLQGYGLYSFIGEPGSGKSTAARLIAGRLKGAEGTIRLSGLDIGAIREEDVLKYVQYVHREGYIFNGTVADNLLIANPYISKKEMLEILDSVELMKVLESKDGVDTSLSGNARELTDGQRMRLLLARAVLTDPRVLILDELTSDIDQESVDAILRAAKELSRNRMVLLITRRLNNAIDSDCILLMESGRISETGTHAGLMEKKERYAALYREQAEMERFARVVDEEIPESFLDNSDFGRTAGERENHETPGDEKIRAGEEAGHERNLSAWSARLNLIRLVLPVSGALAAAAVPGTAARLCGFFISLQSGQAIAGSPGYYDEVSGFAISIILLAAAFGILRFIGRYAEHLVSFLLTFRQRRRVLAALRKLWPLSDSTDTDYPYTGVLPDDMNVMEVYCCHELFPALEAWMSAGIMIICIARINARAAAAAACICLLIGAVLPVCLRNREKRDFSDQCKSDEAFRELLLDSMKGLEDMIRFGHGVKRGHMLSELARSRDRGRGKLENTIAFRKSLSDTVWFAGTLIVLASLLSMYRLGETNLTSLILCVMGLSCACGPASGLSALSCVFGEAAAEAGIRIRRLLVRADAGLDEKTIPRETTPGEDAGLSENLPAVILEHTFCYSGDDMNLNDVSAVFGRGEITGIYGSSGSGKSMMLELIMRLRRADAGMVYIDGRDINSIPEAELRGRQAYLSETTWLSGDTIAENIAIARPGASMDEIRLAAEKAYAHDDIAAIPGGYEAREGEKGVFVSPGLRQRIGLARAFLSGADIWLLDDPTSCLDTYDEALFLRALFEHSGGKTVIIASRRRSVIDLSDRIYRIESDT